MELNTFEVAFFFDGFTGIGDIELDFAIAILTSSADATDVLIPIPKLANALPQADVSQFSTKEVLLI